MDIKYSYLGYSLIFLLLWAVFYILRPDLRRRMLIFSLIIMPLGPLSEFWFLKDYWRRPTITGYPISLEDAVFHLQSLRLIVTRVRHIRFCAVV